MASQHVSSSASANLVGVHYRVGKKIGEGSFGVIFEGELSSIYCILRPLPPFADCKLYLLSSSARFLILLWTVELIICYLGGPDLYHFTSFVEFWGFGCLDILWCSVLSVRSRIHLFLLFTCCSCGGCGGPRCDAYDLRFYAYAYPIPYCRHESPQLTDGSDKVCA